MIGAHVLAVVCALAAGGLGFWQLAAWQAQRELAARDLTTQPVVPMEDLIGPDEAFPGQDLGRRVEVSGTWIDDATVYVADRAHEGVAGYWVVTPLSVTDVPGVDSAVPVVRGWSPEPTAAPADADGATAAVTGWLQPPEGTGAVDDDPTDDVFPQLRVADLVQRVDQDLYGAYVIAEEPTPGLVQADLAAVPKPSSTTGLRNLLYALEWWFFAGFALFLWWKFWQDEQADAAAIEAAATQATTSTDQDAAEPVAAGPAE